MKYNVGERTIMQYITFFCREEGKYLMLAFKLFSGNATLGINNFSNLKLYVFRFGFR